MNSTNNWKRISIRTKPEQYQKIENRAKECNKSINRYMIDSALGTVHGNEYQLSALMKQMCVLQNLLVSTNDYESLRSSVEGWRTNTIQMMGW